MDYFNGGDSLYDIEYYLYYRTDELIELDETYLKISMQQREFSNLRLLSLYLKKELKAESIKQEDASSFLSKLNIGIKGNWNVIPTNGKVFNYDAVFNSNIIKINNATMLSFLVHNNPLSKTNNNVNFINDFNEPYFIYNNPFLYLEDGGVKEISCFNNSYTHLFYLNWYSFRGLEIYNFRAKVTKKLQKTFEKLIDLSINSSMNKFLSELYDCIFGDNEIFGLTKENFIFQYEHFIDKHMYKYYLKTDKEGNVYYDRDNPFDHSFLIPILLLIMRSDSNKFFILNNSRMNFLDIYFNYLKRSEKWKEFNSKHNFNIVDEIVKFLLPMFKNIHPYKANLKFYDNFNPELFTTQFKRIMDLCEALYDYKPTTKMQEYIKDNIWMEYFSDDWYKVGGNAWLNLWFYNRNYKFKNKTYTDEGCTTELIYNMYNEYIDTPQIRTRKAKKEDIYHRYYTRYNLQYRYYSYNYEYSIRGLIDSGYRDSYLSLCKNNSYYYNSIMCCIGSCARPMSDRVYNAFIDSIVTRLNEANKLGMIKNSLKNLLSEGEFSDYNNKNLNSKLFNDVFKNPNLKNSIKKFVMMNLFKS
jgi:hypothetical protein